MTTLKRLFLTGMVMAATIGARAQCALVFDPGNSVHTDVSTILQLNLVTDFCANGSDNLSDQAAFEAASVFIKKRGGYCKLTIPNGVYRVGRQIPGHRGWHQWSVGVLQIDSVKKVEVAGVGSPKIQYLDGLKYGYFDPVTGLASDIDYLSLSVPDRESRTAGMGDMIQLNRSEEIYVHDLLLDGNLYPGKMNVGGKDNVAANFMGIQEAYSGIAIYYTRGVTINNVTARRFGLDGLLVFDYYFSWDPVTEASLPNTGRIYVNRFKSDFNGRQGASFVWGDSIFVSNSSFTNTGMGEITYSGLQAGIDIEPEQMGTIAENFFFDSCTFENNRNTNIAITSGAGSARNIYFKHCKSYNLGTSGNSAPSGSTSFNNVALDIGRHTNLNFSDCEFKGYTHISRNNATNAAEGYKFMRCLFSDCYQKPVSWTITSGQFSFAACALVKQPIENISSALVFAPWTPDGNNRWEYLTIDSSTFDVYDRIPWRGIQATTSKPSIIKNSTVIINTETGPGKSISYTDAVGDNELTTTNVKFFMHPNQSYVHDGVTVAGPSSIPSSWGTDAFYRWSFSPPYLIPGECEDTITVNCGTWMPFSSSVVQMSNAVAYGDAGYQVYPNPAMENRFTLKNLNSQVLYYEFLGVNGGRVTQGQLNGYTSKEFNFPGLSEGIYYLKVVQDRMVKVEKIVLKR